MKIILLQKIKGTGNIGDIKEVADGYALNFLIPQKLAEPATPANINKLQKKQTELVNKSSQELVSAQKIAQKLAGIVLEIKSHGNNEGKLYSAVSATIIVEKLKQKGFDIETKQINLIKPIKEFGEYSVFVVLNHGLEAEITVVVTE